MIRQQKDIKKIYNSEKNKSKSKKKNLRNKGQTEINIGMNKHCRKYCKRSRSWRGRGKKREMGKI